MSRSATHAEITRHLHADRWRGFTQMYYGAACDLQESSSLICAPITMTKSLLSAAVSLSRAQADQAREGASRQAQKGLLRQQKDGGLGAGVECRLLWVCCSKPICPVLNFLSASRR
eukprot:6211125-Pleurochrysis_carterae.AAC.2